MLVSHIQPREFYWPFHTAVSTPVELEAENTGSLEEGEQIRWQLEVPETGAHFSIEVGQGEVVFYASIEITAPNEAFHQWTLQTSSLETVFINPVSQSEQGSKHLVGQQTSVNNTNKTTVTVYTTFLGLGAANTFTLTSGKTQLIT